VLFILAGCFWYGLSDDEKKAIETAEATAKKLNDEGVIATEKDAGAFFESKGVAVTTPDVASFRDQVQKKFLESEFAKSWPEGMIDRINKAGA
jgi:TRAP-type C4-dicarboxylate transport system substrate-binding protein